MDRLRYIIATGFGAGYSPVAPGTAGSLLATLLLMHFSIRPPLLFFLFAAVFFAGVWASSYVAADQGRNDPSIVVVDEIAGMMVPFVAVPASWWQAFFAFLLFRFFDVAKPFPIRRVERLHGGWGIMLDDALAGLYALVVFAVLKKWGIL